MNVFFEYDEVLYEYGNWYLFLNGGFIVRISDGGS